MRLRPSPLDEALCLRGRGIHRFPCRYENIIGGQRKCRRRDVAAMADVSDGLVSRHSQQRGDLRSRALLGGQPRLGRGQPVNGMRDRAKARDGITLGSVAIAVSTLASIQSRLSR